ncbi:MAG TPA: VOC family protein [Rhizomicrobium sp.]|nr:VOC family protein [Rhizomicrobium sp.]
MILPHRMQPCLWFDNQAEEAMNFYVSIFKNSKKGIIARYSEVGPGEPGSVMTVTFELDGQPFVALNGGPMFKFNEAVSFQIYCKDQDEVDYYWSKLTDGGEESQCGWLKDKFGLSWQVVPQELLDMAVSENGAHVKRMTEAMFTMKKLDIAALKAAYNG